MPTQAELHLFAYTRYQFFVNGEYIGRRGPNRFESCRPEYDTWDITNRLHRRAGATEVTLDGRRLEGKLQGIVAAKWLCPAVHTQVTISQVALGHGDWIVQIQTGF